MSDYREKLRQSMTAYVEGKIVAQESSDDDDRAELQGEIAFLKRLVSGMAERIYVQSNLLSRCAERANALSKKA